MIYLDNAATSWPKPESVYQAMDRFLREKGGNSGRGGHSIALAAEETVEETRRLMARFINADKKERVIFTFNCTDALNLGLKGLLKPGEHVITDSIGHNSLVRPLNKLERQGVKVTRIPSSRDGFLLPEDIEKAIIPETRLIAVTHASNVTGIVQPIDEYGIIAQKHDLVFMVDAAQTAGTYPLDVQKDNIDLLAFPGHKGMLGPPGTGALYISSRVELETLREGGTGVYSELQEQPDSLPHKYESGTLNTVGIAGLGAGIKYILQESREKIMLHKQLLLTRLLDGLGQISEVILYKPAGPQASVLSFNLERMEPWEAETILDQFFDIKVRIGLHCAAAAHRAFGTYPLGTIRLSPGYFNTMEEIDFTIEAIGKIAGQRFL